MFNALSHTFRTIVRMVLPSLAATAAVSSQAGAQQCVTTSNHVSIAGLNVSGMTFSNYVNAAVGVAVDTGVEMSVDATGMSGVQLNYISSKAEYVVDDGISGAVAITSSQLELNLTALFSRICSGANVTVNASGMSNAQILVADEFFALVDSLSNLASDKTILVNAFEVSGQTVTGTGAFTINSATLTGASDLRNIASTINLTVPSPFSVSGASSSLAVRGNQLGSLSFNGGGLLTVDGAMGTHDLEARASGVTLAFANSSVTSGSTLTLSVVQAANKTIAGPGTVAIVGPAEVTANSSFANIANATIPGTLTVASGKDLTLTAAQAKGLVVAGSGRVLISGGAVDASTSLTSLASTLDVGSTTGSFSVASGATFTLTAAQADGLTIAGAGTTNIAGNVAADANFTLISTLLNIPGEVGAGKTLTLTTAQGNGRTLGGAGSIALVTNEPTDSVNFRGLTTAGFSFTGSVTSGNTISINAVQAAGCAITGAGTVDILGTNGNDTVTAGSISARLAISALDGADNLTAGSGNDSIDGGAGSDIANFSSSFASATLSAPAATFTVTSSADGTDSVTNVELLAFTDATVAIVGSGGSEYAVLNDALNASGSTKLWGNLAFSSTTVGFTDTATLNAILARCVGGSTFSVNVLGMNKAQLSAVSANTATLGAVTYPPVQVVNAGDPSGYFTTISAAITFASAGDVVDVAAGTYAENIAIAKSLDVRGPNWNVSPNTGTRGAEAVIVPPSSNPASTNVVTVSSSGVTFRGFTVDGDNTALAAAGATDPAFPTASIDALRGIFCSLNGLSNTLIEHNIVRNVANGAIRLEQATNQQPTNALPGFFSIDNLVTDNFCTNCEIGVDVGNSGFAGVTDNTVTNARYGIFFGSMRIQNKSAAQYRVVSGNTLAVRQWGIWFNLYRATPYSVSNNTITAVAQASRTEWFGVMLANVAQMQNSGNYNLLPQAATPEYFVFTNNTIDGAGVDPATTAFGYWCFAVDNGRDTSAVDHFTQVNGGSVSNVDYGVMLRNVATAGTGSGADSVFGTANVGAHLAVSGVAFGVNAGGTGFSLNDNSAWTTTNPAPLVNKRNVQLSVGAGNSITNGATGVSITQPSNLAAADYNPLVTGSISDLAFSGQSGNYITLAMNKAVNGTSATFGGLSGTSASNADLFSLESKFTDAIDSTLLGLVSTKANNVFVPTGGVIANGLAAASANNTVNVQAGTYTDGVLTVNTAGITANSEAGVSGFSFVLGTANTLTLAGAGNVNADGNAGINTLDGSSGINTLNGLAGADTITGGDAADTINGGDDADTLSGNAGADSINGGNGNDNITGGDGADAIDGGSGADTANYAISYVGAITGSLTLSVDGDTVVNVENLAFSDATVTIVGRGGSEYTTLNAANAAVSSSNKLWGNLAINSATFTTAAQLNALTARFVDGSTVTVDVLGMNKTQLSAVAGNATTAAVVAYPPVQVVNAGDPSGYFTTIQAGIDFATAGDTVNVAAGTYAEHLAVNKSITLQGAGRDSNDSSIWLTRINTVAGLEAPSVANVITVSANDVTIRGLQVAGYLSNGIAVSRGIVVDSGESPVDGLTIDNVLCSVHQYGFGVTNGESATDVTITGSKFAANGNGVAIDMSGKIDGLTMTNTLVTGNIYGFTSNSDASIVTTGEPAAVNANTVGLTNVLVTDSQFDGNIQKGLYFEKLNNATFTNISVAGNAVTGMSPIQFPGAGLELSLKYGAYSNIQFNNATMTGNGTGTGATGQGLAIKARNEGSNYSAKPATLTGVTIDGGTISGSALNLVFGNNVSMGSVSFASADGPALAISGGGKAVYIYGTAANGPLNLGAISIAADADLYVDNNSNCVVDATGASFGGKTGAAATLAENFAIAAKVTDKVDTAGLGLVTVKAANVYVNTGGSVALGLAAASASDTVNVQAGVYTDGAVTVNTAGITANSEAGVSGFSFVLGSANTLTLAGAGDVNADGNANANTLAGSAGVNTLNGLAGADTITGGDAADTINGGADNDNLTGNAGVDAIDGGIGIDTANYAISYDGAITGSSTLSVDGDTVVNVELLAFTDATVAIVGRGGSEYAVLNDALNASGSTKLWGNLAVNASTPFSTAAQFQALVARFVGGSTTSLDITGMSSAQLTAILGSEGAFPGFTYPPVRVATIAGSSVTVKNYYTTIAAAITASASGDTIDVAAGTYSENIVVGKSLTLRGAQAGVKATGLTRTANGGESVIDGLGNSSSFVVTIEADNVTVDGFKVDIRNAARDGINTRTGSPVAPATSALRTGITLRNNWVTANLPTRTNAVNGIVFGEHVSNAAQAFSAEIANVTIRDNYIDMVTTSSTATPANQSITGARGIVFTNMFRNSGASMAYTGLVVDGNTVFATYNTIIQAQLQTRLAGAQFTNNLIGNSRSGVNLPTLVSGSVFSNNTIQDIAPSTDYYSNLTGAYLGVVDSTVSGNTFRRIGGTAAMVIAGGRSADATYFPASANSTVSNNSITYNDVALSVNAPYSSGILFESNTVSAAVNVNGVLTGRQAGTTGAQAGSITMSGNTFSNAAFGASPAVAIAQLSSGTTLNPLGNTYDGTLLTSSGDFFAMADKVADRVDAPGLGYVQFKSGEVFITPASFWAASSTTAANVANALAVASANGTVRIKAGAYSGGSATVDLAGLTADAQAGTSGVSFTLGTADSMTLAGAGDMDVNGNANANTFNSNDGANAFTGSGAIDTATMGIPMPSSLAVSGGRIAVGADSVASIERLVFTDGTIAVIGATGSEYATLNGSLGSLTSGEKLFGALAINSSTFATAAELDALTARFVSGSTVSVDVLGMNAAQLVAIAGNATTSPVVVYPPVQVVSGATVTGYFATIEGGINFASSGDTLTLAAGDYLLNSPLSIQKSLTIVGAGASSTFIKSNVTNPGQSDPSGNARGLILIGTAPNAGYTVNISDLTIDGNGKNVWQGIRTFGSGTLSSVAFTGIRYEYGGAGVYYQGTAVAALAAGDLDLVGCSFTNIGRLGVIYFGAGRTGSVSNSTFTGQGLGDRYNSAVEVASSAVVTVSNNVVTDHLGTAVTGTPGDPSFAFFVRDGGSLTLSNNSISNNLYGFEVGAGATGIATCNWWGTTDASTIAGLVTNAGQFSPYLTSGTDSDGTAAGFQPASGTCGGEGAVVVVGSGRSYSTIQAALDASVTTGSSTVSVSAGNYNESPVIKDSGLTVSVATGAYSGSSGTDPLTFTLDGSLASATLAGAGDANASGNTAANTLNGSGAANVLSGGDAADTLSGGAGADTLNGDAGNDSLTGGDGNDTIDGGAAASDVDTAVFTGNLGTISGSSSLTVTSSVSAEGSDTVSNVEIVDFADADVVIVGRAGSAVSTLNAALAAYTGTQKFWGNLEINSSTSFTNSAQFLAIYDRLVTSGSSFTVNMSGMSATQVAAVAAAMPGNLTNVAINSGYTAAEITSLLGQVNGASATIDMTGMNPAQIAASNVGYAAGKTSAVTGWTIRVMAGTVVNSYDLYLDKRTGSDLPGSVERANTLKAANPSINYTVEMLAGTFNLDGRIELNRIALVGAGKGELVANSNAALPPTISGGSIIDMSNSPVDGTYYPQGILALGDGVVMRDFALTSPTRSSGKGDRYGIKSAGPQGDSALTTTNLTIDNVRVHDLKMSALDLNTLVGGTISNVVASYASAGYGFAFSGGSRDTALSNITVLNCAWGDVGVFPWRPSAEGGPAAGTAAHTPSGISFSGTLGITSINCQPYNSTIAVSSGVAGDSGYNAAAQVFVPAAFNRIASSRRTHTNGSYLDMNQVCRQKDLATVLAGYSPAGPFTFSTPVVTNNLGLFEVVSVSGSVRTATAGRTSLDAALAAASAGNEINVWGPSSVPAGTTNSQATPAVSLAAVIGVDVTITGDVPLTNASFASVDILNSLVSKVATSANLSVDLTSMADAKLNGVNALKASFDSIAGQLAAVNNAGTPGIISALNLSDVSLTAYNALPEVTGYLYQTAVATDMTANTREFADINAATILWNKYIGFRNAAYAALTGAPLTADDFAPGARYPTVATAYAALPVGTTLSGEASTVANSATVVTQFNALVLGGRGRTNSLNAMNTNDASISAMNTAFAAALETSQAYDKLDAGITVANSATEITYLFGFSAVNATSVNASGMIPAQLTSVSTGISYVSAITGLSLTNAQSDGEIGNLLSKTTGAVAIATDMNSAKLSALGVGAGSIAADGITGTLAIDVNVSSLDALLGKTAVAATVNVNATGFDAVAKGVLSGKISKVDAIANLALASSEDPTEITNLLSVATAAVVNATGMDYNQFNALGASAAIAKVAADGISGTFTITKDVTVIGAILGKTQIAATVTVNATGMSQPQLAEVSANITKVDTLSDVSVTSALTVEELSSLMSNPSTTNVFADATGMGADKLNVLAQYSSKLAANGVTGSVIVTSSVTDTDLSAFLAKVDAGATVEVNAAGMSATALSAAASNSTKIDSLYNLTLASAQSASEITTLLGLSVASAAEGKAMALATATDMDAAKLSALGGSYLKLAANGITGNVLLVSAITDTNITNLFSNIALAANVRVNGSGMGSTTLAILLTNIAKVDSAFNLALSNAQTAAELATLLGKSDVSSASADATNMDSNVGGDLATLADNYTKLASAGVSGSIVINSNLTSVQIANLLSKVSYAVSFVGGTTVVIDAQGMTDAQLTSVAAAVVASGDPTTQASVFDVNNLTVSGAQQASEIAALLNVTAPDEATVVATGMTQEQLAEVGDYPSSVSVITGTIEITSDLTAAQIQAIMGNASTSANVTIDPNGFNAFQQAALYSNALLLVTTEATPGEELTGETIVKQGDTFVVVVEASGLTIDAVGVQARLNYDSSRVQFVDVLPTVAFETVIYGTAGSSGSQSYVTFATGIDVFDDSSTGIRNGDVARIRFVATAAFCNATDVVSLATSGFSNKFVASSTNPAPIPAVGTNLIDVSSLNNLAFASTWSANESLPADAGTTAGAFKANPGVTASNNCYTSVPVTFTITYPNASTGTTWPARFPVGTSTVVWRSEDLGGNIITLTRTVEVFNYQLMTMAPRYFIAAGAYTAGNRTITVRLSEDGLASVEQAQLFAFNANGQATSVDVQVPVKASYSCVSVKDDQRSLARAASSISVVGTKYDVAFATGGDGAMKLGDSNADNLVDILDFGVYIANRFPGYGAGSDYNNNLSVNNQDFAIFATNFLQAGDTCAGGFLAGQTPRDRVSVRELRRRGMGELIAADINGDGWVDVTDIQLAMQN